MKLKNKFEKKELLTSSWSKKTPVSLPYTANIWRLPPNIPGNKVPDVVRFILVPPNVIATDLLTIPNIEISPLISQVKKPLKKKEAIDESIWNE